MQTSLLWLLRKTNPSTPSTPTLVKQLHLRLLTQYHYHTSTTNYQLDSSSAFPTEGGVSDDWSKYRPDRDEGEQKKRENSGGFNGFRWGIYVGGALIPIGAAILLYSRQAKAQGAEEIVEQNDLFSEDSRRRVFFNYEKRLRDMSTREKVFNYFSCVEKDGNKYMTPDDLLHALVAVYPPEGAPWVRTGSLPGEKRSDIRVAQKDYVDQQFFKELDTDGDGKISFSEYLLILALVSIPDSDISTVFKVMDIHGNGVVSFDEFKVILDHLKSKAGTRLSTAQKGNKMMGIKADSAQDSALLQKFFGGDLSQELELRNFEAWLEKLQRQLVLLEFSYLDWNNTGWVTGRDFARTVVSSANIREVNVYMNQVDKMPRSLATEHVTLADFCAFAEMRRYLPQLTTAFEFYSGVRGVITKEVFLQLVKLVSNVELAQGQVDILFYLFGNRQGHLDFRSLFEVLENRGGKGITNPWLKTRWEWSPAKLLRRIRGEAQAVLYEFKEQETIN